MRKCPHFTNTLLSRMLHYFIFYCSALIIKKIYLQYRKCECACILQTAYLTMKDLLLIFISFQPNLWWRARKETPQMIQKPPPTAPPLSRMMILKVSFRFVFFDIVPLLKVTFLHFYTFLLIIYNKSLKQKETKRIKIVVSELISCWFERVSKTSLLKFETLSNLWIAYNC